MPRTKRQNRGKTARSGKQMHRSWLELVQTEGPFLSVPVLRAIWPNGVTPFGSADSAEARALVDLRRKRPQFEAAWDAWHQDALKEGAHSVQETFAQYRCERDAWVDLIAGRVFGWGEVLDISQVEGSICNSLSAMSPDGAVRVAPSGVLVMDGRPCALMLVVDPQQESLDRNYPEDGWSASVLDRMAAMLRGKAGDRGCSIGVVTDGRWWALVSAPQGGPTAWGMVDSLTWTEDAEVRDAFVRLLDVRLLRAGGGIGGHTLPQMFHDSIAQSEEITESLGQQVRAAVELLVSAFSDSSRRARAAGLPDPLPEDDGEVYEAAVAVMMRVVFLLFAQERDLLPSGMLFTHGYGLLGVLDELNKRALSEGEESMDGTSLTWHRLLATSRAIYQGSVFEGMRLPAYGGSVFDPDRHPFLTAMNDRGELKVTVSDRVMLHVLKSVQEVSTKSDDTIRRLSFKEIDVEQIGYIYEGLLGFTCVRATECVLGLIGKKEDEPELELRILEDIRASSGDDRSKIAEDIAKYLKDEGNLASNSIPKKSIYEKGFKASADQSTELRLAQATRDETLKDALRFWMPIVRSDLRGKPVVFEPGDLYVTATSSRRDAGAHYTPRSLAEDVVVHALRPLVYNPGPCQTNDETQWRRLPSNEILDLKVADIACGSGAFLVAATRYLAGELSEAWVSEGLYVDSSPEQRRLLATRKVVANCIYGVDINDMAVEMCKLSLWLVSLDSERPFSFVDNKILVGNSLLGVTSLAQVENLNLDGKLRTVGNTKTARMFYMGEDGLSSARNRDLGAIMRDARSLRARLAEDISETDPMRGAASKANLMRRYDEKVGMLRHIADALIAVGLSVGGKPGKKLDAALDNLSFAVARAYPADGEVVDRRLLDGLIERGLTPTVSTDYERWKCLHWPLEFPEVDERGGFDAIIGNPPFLGGQKLTGSMGTNMRDWYINVIAAGKTGSADLCAYFFLRAYGLIRYGGMLGLLATNTIAQGATREVGLDQMVEKSFKIVRAIRSEKWPVSSANLEYAAVWGTKNVNLDNSVRCVCDGEVVSKISTLLEPQGRVEGKPIVLKENEGIAFIGNYVLGKGFILEPEEVMAWIEEEPKNKEVLFPYLNGEDLNSRPDCSASRWVIDFGERTKAEAEEYLLPWKRVLDYVYPERSKKNAEKYPRMVFEWWKHWCARPQLARAIDGLNQALVIARVSSAVMPMVVKSSQVFSDALVVFASDSFAFQAALSSSMHQLWGIVYGSGMKNDPRYTPSDVFDTFPRPKESSELERIGQQLDTDRREIMLHRQLGLTALYNLVNDPRLPDSADSDVAHMRQLHKKLDEIVMAAYGWDDVPLNHGFYEYRKMMRWTVCPQARVEILDRLLEENHRRAALEKEGGRA